MTILLAISAAMVSFVESSMWNSNAIMRLCPGRLKKLSHDKNPDRKFSSSLGQTSVRVLSRGSGLFARQLILMAGREEAADPTRPPKVTPSCKVKPSTTTVMERRSGVGTDGDR
jgi:hypothetical protein